jgi:phosphoribosylglycinamide formyltransferase 2
MSFTARILLLGSGELGKEFAISAKRLGAWVVACDSYAGAPAMQVADEAEVFPMLDGDRLREVIARHAPDFVVPEVEAIRTEVLAEVEAGGTTVVPSARATMMTMNRDSIRELAAGPLGLRTSRYRFAESLEEAEAAAAFTGFPCVVKPVMSSSGKGQSTVAGPRELRRAWDYAVARMRGDRVRVIVEEFVRFDYEITLLTVCTRDGVRFCPPIGHRQEQGDYRESWQPTPMSPKALREAEEMARAVVHDLGGYGLYGVEYFVADEVIFSELSPRPHDTGMVTLLSQNLSEFDLHARAILGLPIPEVSLRYPAAASAVILADRESERFGYEGLDSALALGGPDGEVDVRIFGKPTTRPNRRMGVALASGSTADSARALAVKAAGEVRLRYDRLHL